MIEKEKPPLPSRGLLTVIGPGILFAASAVGISHLVQATRAGANYNLEMLSIILLACLIKYPAIRFGSEYAAATGKNLILSYRKTGVWALLLYATSQIASVTFVIAAMSLLTAGLIKSVFNIPLSDIQSVAILLVLTTVLLMSGRYQFLEKLNKLIVPVFTVLILVSTLMVLDRIDWSLSHLVPLEIDAKTMIFIVILGGFMPAPVDASVLQSLWICAKAEKTGYLPTAKETRLDFNVGFITTLLLAFCFALLGAGVMHNANIVLETGVAGFANQVINMFASVIGEWSYPIIAAATILIMYSTTITVLDGYSRIAEAIHRDFFPNYSKTLTRIRTYDLALVLISVGSITVLVLFLESFTAFIDITSIIVFVLAPIVSYLNHRAIFSEEVPIESQPGLYMKIWSVVGLISMLVLCLIYLYLRFTN